MALNHSIQIGRGTRDPQSSDGLLDGELYYNKSTNKLSIGSSNNTVVDVAGPTYCHTIRLEYVGKCLVVFNLYSTRNTQFSKDEISSFIQKFQWTGISCTGIYFNANANYPVLYINADSTTLYLTIPNSATHGSDWEDAEEDWSKFAVTDKVNQMM